MLLSLSIRNFVLIEDAVLEFHPGLNVLTGETGAARPSSRGPWAYSWGRGRKKVLVGAAAPDALIQAVFELDDADIREIADDAKLLVGEITPGELIVSRRLGREGRNRCFVNDTAVTLGAMAVIVGGLLSFAGQHEYRRLLNPRYQLTVLDQWAGTEMMGLATDFRATFDQARAAGRMLKEARSDCEARKREIALLPSRWVN